MVFGLFVQPRRARRGLVTRENRVTQVDERLGLVANTSLMYITVHIDACDKVILAVHLSGRLLIIVGRLYRGSAPDSPVGRPVPDRAIQF